MNLLAEQHWKLHLEDATIVSNKGGLPETSEEVQILNKLNSEHLYKVIKN